MINDVNNKKSFFNKLFPEELFGFIMLTFLLVVSLVFHKLPSFNRITGRHYFYFFTYSVLIFLLFGGRFKSLGKLIRNFFPLILVTTVFENLGDVVTIFNSHYADWTLIRIDKFLFGGDASLWMQKFYTPWLSNIMHSAYTSYYFIPPLAGMLLYLSGKYKEFRDFIVAVTFTAFLGYIGYVLVPAIGPKYTLAHLYTRDINSGVLMAKVMKMIHDYEPFKADCFPSLHTAHTLVSMIFIARFFNKFISIPFSLWGSLLIISTMYGRHHYAIDVVAGIILAVFNVYLAGKVNTFWYKNIFADDWRAHYPERVSILNLKKFFRQV